MKRVKESEKASRVIAHPHEEGATVSEGKPAISNDLLVAFERFYEFHPAKRLSKNLRSLLLEFLMYDGSNEAAYLRDLVSDLGGLFLLLDAMEEERERIAAQDAYF